MGLLNCCLPAVCLFCVGGQLTLIVAAFMLR